MKVRGSSFVRCFHNKEKVFFQFDFLVFCVYTFNMRKSTITKVGSITTYDIRFSGGTQGWIIKTDHAGDIESVFDDDNEEYDENDTDFLTCLDGIESFLMQACEAGLVTEENIETFAACADRAIEGAANNL